MRSNSILPKFCNKVRIHTTPHKQSTDPKWQQNISVINPQHPLMNQQYERKVDHIEVEDDLIVFAQYEITRFDDFLFLQCLDY